MSAKVKADPCRRAARADRGELRRRGARAEVRRSRRCPVSARPRCCTPSLSARQLDADKFLARDNAKTMRKTATSPRRRGCCRRCSRAMAGMPRAPIRTQDRVQRRADHAGRTSAAESIARHCAAMPRPGRSTGWTCVRPARPRFPSRNNAEIIGAAATSPARSTSIAPIPMRCSPGCRAATTWSAARKSRCGVIGDVSMTEGRIAIDALNAEIDGGAIEGRVALSAPRPSRRLRASKPS